MLNVTKSGIARLARAMDLPAEARDITIDGEHRPDGGLQVGGLTFWRERGSSCWCWTHVAPDDGDVTGGSLDSLSELMELLEIAAE